MTNFNERPQVDRAGGSTATFSFNMDDKEAADREVAFFDNNLTGPFNKFCENRTILLREVNRVI